MDEKLLQQTFPSFSTDFENASIMIQSCIGPYGVGRRVQGDQRMNATCNASLLQENLSESINDINGNQAKNVTFQDNNPAIRRAELTPNFLQQQYITSRVSCSNL